MSGSATMPMVPAGPDGPADRRRRPPAPAPARGGRRHVEGGAAERLVVDGANVIGAVPDGWWRDRAGAARTLHAALARLAATGVDVALVLEGPPVAGLGEGEVDGVRVHWARRRGRDAGDDRIRELLAEEPEPQTVTVVTADRALAADAHAAGARVGSPRQLRRRLGA